MTKQSAKEQLSLLQSSCSLSLQDVRFAYKLALVLGEREEATRFKEIYQELMYDEFLEIALSISNPYYLEKFFNLIGEWDKLYCCDFKSLYVLMLLKQKESIEDFEKLYEVLKENCCVFSRLEDSELLLNTLGELQEMYLEELKGYLSRNVLKSIVYEVLSSNDMDLLRKQFQETPLTPDWMRRSILERMVMLLVDSDREEAMRLLSTTGDKYDIENVKLKIAKKIFANHPAEANAIVSELPKNKQYAFKAYEVGTQKNEEAIVSLIKLFSSLLEKNFIKQDEYNDFLVAIGLTIVDDFPMLALSVIDMTDTNSPDFISIFQTAAENYLLQGNIELAIKYFPEIDVDVCQQESLSNVIRVSDDPEILLVVQSLADELLDETRRFFIYEELSKKMPIAFETMFALLDDLAPTDTDYMLI